MSRQRLLNVIVGLVISTLCLIALPLSAYAQSENVLSPGIGIERLRTGDIEEIAQSPPKKIYELRDIQRGRAASPLENIRQPSLIFQSNVGQADQRFPFIVRGVNFAAGFTPNAIATTVVRYPVATEQDEQSSRVKGNTVLLTFKGASQASIVGENPIKGSVNTVIGSDKARWRKQIQSFNTLVYRNLYPGVQMFVDGNTGRLEYGFVLQPTADASKIRIVVNGVEKLKVDSVGNLVMETAGGSIVQPKPRFVEQVAGKKREVKGRFVIVGANEYGFVVEQRTPNSSLLIDPEIVFSSYFGGSGNEGMLSSDGGAVDFIGRGFDIAIGPNGNIYVIGMTASPDFPVTTSGSMVGSADVFVMRIDPTLPVGGQLVYATFIGGSSSERGRAVAPLEDGRVYITGHTSSRDFPTSGGTVQPTPERSGAYVVRLAPDGTFEIGTRIGRSASYHPNSVVFNKRSTENQGFVYVAGSVQSFGSSEATAGAVQSNFGGGRFDGFLVKLDSELSRYEYFTYLGGEGHDVIMDLDVNDGFAFVTGTTTSVNFPTTELASQAQHSQANTGIDCAASNRPRQCFDAFVARFQRDGTGLVYNTLIGASREEYARGIGVASNNQATVTGAARATTGNLSDIFVARLEGGGENLLFDRRLAAQGTDHGEEIVVDRFGRAHFVGTVSVDGLATADTFHGGGSDIFYGRVTNTGDVDFFSYLGGAGEDRGFAIAAAGASEQNFCAAVAGSTTSDNIETLNALSGGDRRSGRADLLLFTLCDIDFVPNASNFTKSGPSTVVAGSTFNYSITVTNGGDQPAPVVISDTVPNNVTVTSVTGPGCTRTGNSVNCSFSAPPGATTILITVRAGEQCGPVGGLLTSVTNTATIRVGNQEFRSSVNTRINCRPPLCGNQRLDPGEQCDGGSNCRPNCTTVSCGDGIFDPPGEQCDDGNRDDSDRCTNRCHIQEIERDTCSRNGPNCAGALVCGKKCSYFGGECRLSFFGWFCITEEEESVLCDTTAACMPAGDASITIGQ